MEPMPRVPPFDRPATYDDLLKVPDIQVAEIVDGELHASPRPAPRHARAGSSLGGLVARTVTTTAAAARAAGGSSTSPNSISVGTSWCPTWAGWRRSRMPRLPDTAYFPLAPDWICEITLAVDRVARPGEEARHLRARRRRARVARRSRRAHARGPAPRVRPVDDPRDARRERSRAGRAVCRYRPRARGALGLKAHGAAWTCGAGGAGHRHGRDDEPEPLAAARRSGVEGRAADGEGHRVGPHQYRLKVVVRDVATGSVGSVSIRR